MDKAVYEKVIQFTREVCNNFIVQMIVLYGSYARGMEREYSDIDIAIVVDKIEGDILELNLKLYKLRRDIDERIEPVLISRSGDKSGFLESILKYGTVIYNKNAA